MHPAEPHREDIPSETRDRQPGRARRTGDLPDDASPHPQGEEARRRGHAALTDMPAEPMTAARRVLGEVFCC